MYEMKKILSNGEIVCLSCGDGQDGALVSTDDRPELTDEICPQCDNERTINDIKRELEEGGAVNLQV